MFMIIIGALKALFCIIVCDFTGALMGVLLMVIGSIFVSFGIL